MPDLPPKIVRPNGWVICVIRSRVRLSSPSKVLCSILSKNASTQYSLRELEIMKMTLQMTLCPLGSINVFSNNNLNHDKRILGRVGRDSEKILHFTGFLMNWKIRSSIQKCQCTQSETISLFLIPNSLKEETHFLGKLLCLPCCPYLQSMARPLGQPSVVFTIGKAWDPSLQALMILAGRNQSVQNIYLEEHMSEDT